MRRVHPPGFEPGTFGSVDGQGVCRNSFDDQLLARGPQLRSAIQQHDPFIESHPMTPVDSSFKFEKVFGEIACDNLDISNTEVKGLEHAPISLEKPGITRSSGAFSGAVEGSSVCFRSNSSLSRVTAAWASLPPHVQETILILVDASTKRKAHQCNQVSSKSVAKIFSDPRAESDQLRRELLKALRHRPYTYSLNIDIDGWVEAIELSELIDRHLPDGASKNVGTLLELISNIDPLGQLQIDGVRVRAAYGHSFFEFSPTSEAIPDEPLFHGTDATFWPSISASGLLPGKRRFVQLTTDFEYAELLARRRNQKPLILQVMTHEAIHRGVRFFETGCHVWQATSIPSECLQLWNTEPIDVDDWYSDAIGANDADQI